MKRVVAQDFYTILQIKTLQQKMAQYACVKTTTVLLNMSNNEGLKKKKVDNIITKPSLESQGQKT